MDDISVISTGRLRVGVDREAALAKLSELFDQPSDIVAKLVEGRSVLIKRGLDAATAERYVMRLTAIGLECRTSRDILKLDAEALQHTVASGARDLVVSPPSPATLPVRATTINVTDDPTLVPRELWEAVAQKNAPYYVSRWGRYAGGRSTFPSWHWPALFLSCWWAFYRKAWVGALVLLFLPFAVWLLAAIVIGLFDLEDRAATTVSVIAWIIAWILPAMLANSLYYHKAKTLVSEARLHTSDVTAQLAFLQAKGGTSGAFAIIASCVGIVSIIGILAAIALPAYQDYVVRSKVAAVLAALAPVQQRIVDTYRQTQTLPSIDRGVLADSNVAQYIDDLSMDGHGVLIVSLKAASGSASRIRLTPRRQGDGVVWNCETIDTPLKYLPASCRQ